jgi:hypothetical protein
MDLYTYHTVYPDDEMSQAITGKTVWYKSSTEYEKMQCAEVQAVITTAIVWNLVLSLEIWIKFSYLKNAHV